MKRSKTIGLDLHGVHGIMQGSRTYISELTKALVSLRPDYQFVLYVSADSIPDDIAALKTDSVKIASIPISRFQRLVTHFPRRCQQDNIDILHVQYIAPFRMKNQFVVSVHDILHETIPEFFPWKMRKAMSYLYPRSLKNAARVIALSQYTKDELIGRYNIEKHQICVVYPGVSTTFTKSDDRETIEKTKSKYGIDGEYILFVGRIEPRKNVAGLIEAYLKLPTHIIEKYKLIISGMVDPLLSDKDLLLLQSQKNQGIMHVGAVSQEDLPSIYSGATLFAYPSYGEGFGLPVVEAMACGVPVLTSNVTALPEAAGDAGVLVDPQESAKIAQKMCMILENAELQNTMRTKGIDHVAQFTWKRTAKCVAEVYDELLSSQ